MITRIHLQSPERGRFGTTTFATQPKKELEHEAEQPPWPQHNKDHTSPPKGQNSHWSNQNSCPNQANSDQFQYLLKSWDGTLQIWEGNIPSEMDTLFEMVRWNWKNAQTAPWKKPGKTTWNFRQITHVYKECKVVTLLGGDVSWMSLQIIAQPTIWSLENRSRTKNLGPLQWGFASFCFKW